ncbi:AMP-dependent synthetase/ligase [Flavobacteriales bacterium]|nr:AMP-dependent synthetase/ligase [Flavobacteriales bacterium]MDB4088726.1 AMP-dependent synthetase/ligase [Flavobacteriales bacterium]
MTKITRAFDFAYHQLDKYPQEDCLVDKREGKWVKTSTQEYVNKAMEMSRGLIKMGIKPGDKVGLISNNRSEWNIADVAILQIGAVSVPIYPTITEKEYTYIFNNAEIKLCVVSDEELYGKVSSIKPDVPSLGEVFTFNKVEGARHWTEILEEGKDVPNSEVESIRDNVSTEDLATLIYTSGTTGLPKGVMLTHSNLVSNVLDSLDRVPVAEEAKALSFLPVCHVFERMILYLYQYIGVSVYFAESLETVGDDIREVKPNLFTAVPRLIEKVYAKIIAKGEELSGVKKALFFWAVKLGQDWDIDKGGLYNFKLKIARKLIFSKWQEALGGNIDLIVSGSAALESSLMRVFYAADMPIYEGYGLTETSPVVSVISRFNDGIRMGTVGKVLKSVEVKIADTGEILVKGPNVMKGYYKAPEKTAEVIDKDGWFHTGDKGEFVDTHFLKITGRIKQIFKTSGGKYVSPELMENKFKLSPFIEQIMVIGENKKHTAALVIPAYEALKQWADHKEISYTSNEDLLSNEKVINKFDREIAKYNEEFARWETVKKFKLIAKEWSIDTGELTPTLKLKRNVVMERCANLVDDIYA